LVEFFIPEPQVARDFVDLRSDECELEGVICICGSMSKVFLVAPSGSAMNRSGAPTRGADEAAQRRTWSRRSSTTSESAIACRPGTGCMAWSLAGVETRGEGWERDGREERKRQ
jgi:hypothetical protein